ncbi:hypothetical protein EX30DRAFT_371711 [Ascodesmis nigricans]|uniref:Uncharacterized protein n=1 Tax=Ascodesmis nigricans TaxID=341454 RepID=A0A4V3SIP7_9PEZI|nr:hypothetical protein EX30DRAFT_371711 [Ascodesmis nigricans]
MRPPPPAYPPPPTPSAHALPAGYTITLSGPPEAVTKQQRLLPLSRNILCLPALTWSNPNPSTTPNPSNTKRSSGRNASRNGRSPSIESQDQSATTTRGRSGSRNSRTNAADQPCKPTMSQIRNSVLKLHQEFLHRYELAREFLESPRGLADSDRRIVIYNGSERDVKAVCIEGLRQGLKDDEEVEKVWHEILEGGVDSLLDYSDGHSTPRGNPGRSSRADSFLSGEGIKHTQNTDRLERGNSVSTTHSSIRSHSPLRTSFTSEEVGDFRRLSTHSFSRPRLAAPPFGALPPLPISEEVGLGVSFARHFEKTGEGGSEPDDAETQRADSTYSSAQDSILLPHVGEQGRLGPSLMLDFGFDAPSKHRRSSSPMRTNRVDSVIDPSTSLSPRRLPDRISNTPVEPLFPNLREDVVINLVPDATSEMDDFVEKLLTTDIARKHSTTSIHFAPLGFRISSPTVPSTPLTPGPFRLAPFKVFLTPEKSSLETQNEIRALLTKYIPPSNTAAETPATLEFPEASKWLLDSEGDLFAPLFSHGFEGLPETLCPSLDQILAVGADGRELKESTLVDETERQACGLASSLSEEIEGLGNHHGSRGCRVALKHTLRTMLSYVRSYPGVTIDDIAAGHFILPCLEQCLKQNPAIRLVVIEFDLKTGSQAILTLRSLLPPSLFKLLVIGEPSGSGSAHVGNGNRIYVRTSIGKTTMSFSALPSPLLKDKPRIRKLESAKMSVLARADSVGSPWTKPENHDYRACVAVAQNAIGARRIECGVIVSDSHSRENVNAVTSGSALGLSFPAPRSRSPTPTKTAPIVLPIRAPNKPPVLPIKTSSIPPVPSLPLSAVSSTHSSHLEVSSSNTRRGSTASHHSEARSEYHVKISSDCTMNFPPPPNARNHGIPRRDSDANSHGGGVSISSPVTTTTTTTTSIPKPPVHSPIKSPVKSRFKGFKKTSNAKANKILGKESKEEDDWRGGSYLIPDDEVESDDEAALELMDAEMRVETLQGLEMDGCLELSEDEMSPTHLRDRKTSKAWRLLGIGA